MLQSTLQSDLAQAQLQKDVLKVSTLRMLLSEVTYAKIQKGQDLTDQDVIAVAQREVKKRKEAAAGFRQGGREEQAQKEEQEAEILMAYLPKQLSDEELTKVVEDTITEVGASSLSDMGKVIGVVMNKTQGQVDGGRVSALVKEKLGL